MMLMIILNNVRIIRQIEYMNDKRNSKWLIEVYAQNIKHPYVIYYWPLTECLKTDSKDYLW